MLFQQIIAGCFGRDDIVTRRDEIGFDDVVVVDQTVSIEGETARWPTRAVARHCIFVTAVGAETVAGADGDRGRFVARAVDPAIDPPAPPGLSPVSRGC